MRRDFHYPASAKTQDSSLGVCSFSYTRGRCVRRTNLKGLRATIQCIERKFAVVRLSPAR